MVNKYRNDTIVNVHKNADASAKQGTQAGFELVTATVRFLGFGSDGTKNQAPAQRGIFLGGGLDSNTDGTEKCSKFIDADRKEYVIGCCFEMENRKGAVRVRELMQLLGTLSFCASIVNPIRPCLRSGFDLIRGAKIHARARTPVEGVSSGSGWNPQTPCGRSASDDAYQAPSYDHVRFVGRVHGVGNGRLPRR